MFFKWPFLPDKLGKWWLTRGWSFYKLAWGPEPWLLQEDVKGFNLRFDLKERPFSSEWQIIWEALAGITVHLADIYIIWEWWVEDAEASPQTQRPHQNWSQGENFRQGISRHMITQLSFSTSLWIWLLSYNSCTHTHTQIQKWNYSRSKAIDS